MNPSETQNDGSSAALSQRPQYSHQDVVDGEAGVIPGARVLDKEGDGESVAVVLKILPQTVSQVYVDGTAVSEFPSNAEYDPDSTAVVVVYEKTLYDEYPDGRWEQIDRACLAPHVQEVGMETYTFPSERLETVSGE